MASQAAKRPATGEASGDKKRAKLLEGASTFPRHEQFQSLEALAQGLPDSLYDAFNWKKFTRDDQFRHIGDSIPMNHREEYWRLLKRYEAVRFPTIEETEKHLNKSKAVDVSPTSRLQPSHIRTAINTFKSIRLESEPNSLLQLLAAQREADYFSYMTQRASGKIKDFEDFEEQFEEVIVYLEGRLEAKNRAIMDSRAAEDRQARQQEVDEAVSEALKRSQSFQTPSVTTTARWSEGEQSTLLSDEYLQRDFRAPADLVDNTITWTDIQGLAAVKHRLERAIRGSELHQQQTTPQGHLLFGPPGTGKTTLAYSLAKHMSRPLFVCKAASIKGKLQGETPKLVELIFEQAIANQPSIILMDEAEALLSDSKSLDTSAIELQGAIKQAWSNMIISKAKVLVIGTTTQPWHIPEGGFERRFRYHLYVTLPDRAARERIWRHHMSASLWRFTDDLEALLQYSDRLSPDDIQAAVNEAENLKWMEAMDLDQWSYNDQTSRWMSKVGGEKHLKDISEAERGQLHPGFLTPGILMSWLKQNKVKARALASAEKIQKFQDWADTH
ncbi:MAG: hypothetical protein Q9227_008938 [Pyrenula ochraceoflavens]